MFDRVIPDFLTASLPSFVLGLVIVLVLSASITTLSSITLVSASSMTVDLVHAVKKDLSKQKAVLTTRLLCVVFLIAAVIIGLTKSPIQLLMSFSWGTVSGSFMGPYLLGLYWKNATKAGARAGMLGGFSVSIRLAILSGFNTANSPLYGVIAMATSVSLTWLVSLFTAKFEKAHIESIFEEKQSLAA